VYAIAGTPTYAITAYAITGVICIRYLCTPSPVRPRTPSPVRPRTSIVYLFISTPAYIVAAYARSIIYPFINGRVRHRRTKYVITIATNTNK
jgi:hypothetical protein